MNKDVIYIDVEDDITAIIGKVKESKEKIVALVPPKRIGVLQSAVNLRLLERAAKQNSKRLVLISNNSALGALAAAAKIPVAKNLQSKPELAEIAVLDVDDGEDIIDGSQLPIGEHARVGATEKASTVLGSLSINDPLGDDSAKATPPTAGAAPVKPRVKSGIKVPNFNSFRKKLIFGIGGGLLLIAFLVWATFIAPQATVIITARTTESSMNAKVTFSPTMATDMAANTLKSASMQTKKDVSADFEATESKDVGEKAKGQVVFKNCETFTPQTVPAGTVITSGSKNYVTQAAASVPAGSGSFLGCSSAGTSSAVAVVAQEIGETYNIANGTTFSVAGHASGSSGAYFNAISTTDMSGGTKRQVKVVSANDIQNAIDQLAKQNTDEIKKQLTEQFDKSYVVLDQTFKIDQGTPQSTPAKGQEVASGSKAKLTASITYSLVGITRADVSKFLDDYFANQLKDVKDQRAYANGADASTLTNIAPAGDGYAANLVATAKIGPKIDDTAIKETAKGKRYGDVQSAIEAIQGVDNVDVKFWPFWVTSVPGDINRIKVEFNLNESK